MYIFTRDIYYNLSGPSPDILEIIEGKGGVKMSRITDEMMQRGIKIGIEIGKEHPSLKMRVKKFEKYFIVVLICLIQYKKIRYRVHH